MTNEQLMCENERLRQELASRDRDMAKLRERLQKLESERRISPPKRYWFTGKYTLEELQYCYNDELCDGCPMFNECDAQQDIVPYGIPFSDLVLHAKKEG
jgi:predicted nuclease with TOPRIM domain